MVVEVNIYDADRGKEERVPIEEAKGSLEKGEKRQRGCEKRERSCTMNIDFRTSIS